MTQRKTKSNPSPEKAPEVPYPDQLANPVPLNPVTQHKDLMQRAEEISKGLQHLRVVESLDMLFSHEDSKAMTQLIGSLVRIQWKLLTQAAELEASLNETNSGE